MANIGPASASAPYTVSDAGSTLPKSNRLGPNLRQVCWPQGAPRGSAHAGSFPSGGAVHMSTIALGVSSLAAPAFPLAPDSTRAAPEPSLKRAGRIPERRPSGERPASKRHASGTRAPPARRRQSAAAGALPPFVWSCLLFSCFPLSLVFHSIGSSSVATEAGERNGGDFRGVQQVQLAFSHPLLASATMSQSTAERTATCCNICGNWYREPPTMQRDTRRRFATNAACGHLPHPTHRFGDDASMRRARIIRRSGGRPPSGANGSP